MRKIVEFLLIVINKEERNSTNFIIAEYLLKNLTTIDNFTTVSLAKECHVSKTSISRFCRKLGLQDFMELQSLTKGFYPDVNSKFYFRRKDGDVVRDYIDEIILKEENLVEKIDQSILHEIACDIHNYENVFLMGHLQSGNIAFTLQHDLTPLKKYAYCTSEIPDQRDILLNATSKDLIIVFSVSGYFFRSTLLRDRVLNKEDKPRIYLITTTSFLKPEYVYKMITLDNERNYASSQIIIQIYASLICLFYKNYIDTVS